MNENWHEKLHSCLNQEFWCPWLSASCEKRSLTPRICLLAMCGIVLISLEMQKSKFPLKNIWRLRYSGKVVFHYSERGNISGVEGGNKICLPEAVQVGASSQSHALGSSASIWSSQQLETSLHRPGHTILTMSLFLSPFMLKWVPWKQAPKSPLIVPS